MKVIGAKVNTPVVTRSKPGIPDIRHINAQDLVASIAEFTKQYLGDVAEIVGPPDRLCGSLAISPTILARALKATVANFCQDGTAKLVFSELYNEVHLTFESSATADLARAAAVAKEWKRVGFRVLTYGLTLTMAIPYNDALSFVLRQTRPSAFKAELKNAYFW